jgi:hypothetical protein
MPKYHFECEQKSARWYELRAGIPTASCFSKIVTPGGKASKQAQGYMSFLLAEYVLGRSLENEEAITFWMERGTELEESAVRAYEFQTGAETNECAIVTTDDELIAASPDRLVGEDGICEIKCPKPHIHVGRMLHNEIDDDYRCQLQGQLWVMEREWVDILSYHPQLPPVIRRVDRDEKYIELLSAGVRTFVNVMLQRRVDLDKRYGPFVKPEPLPTSHKVLEGAYTL